MNISKWYFDENNLVKIFSNIKKKSKFNFIESIDIAINLDLNVKDVNQNIKGSVLLPYNTGKFKKVIVFAPKSKEELAYNAGAFFVGTENLFYKIKNNLIKYDVVISTLDSIKLVSKLGEILGPKGLMPNIKLGTLTDNLEDVVSKFVKGQITYKNDKFGIIHSTIGKLNFTNNQLLDNFLCFVNSVKLNIFNQFKNNIFLKKIFLSSTMGKSFLVDFN